MNADESLRVAPNRPTAKGNYARIEAGALKSLRVKMTPPEIRFLHAPAKSKRSLYLASFALFYSGSQRTAPFTTPFATQFA
jgi:hypothetical protein